MISCFPGHCCARRDGTHTRTSFAVALLSRYHSRRLKCVALGSVSSRSLLTRAGFLGSCVVFEFYNSRVVNGRLPWRIRAEKQAA